MTRVAPSEWLILFDYMALRFAQRHLCRNALTSSWLNLSSRYISSDSTQVLSQKIENPLTDTKPKPKSTTPLRRSASASLPIRANPTPTRGSIQPIFTLATAERYLLSRLRSRPNLPAGSQALHESWWIPKWGDEGKEGEVFVFSNGSIVCWGLGEADTRKFAAEVIDGTPDMEVGPLKEHETEELDFVLDPIEWGWCVFWVLLVTNEVSMFAERPGYRETWFFWVRWILWSLISYRKNCLPWFSLKKLYWLVMRSLRHFQGRRRSQHSKCLWTTISPPWHSFLALWRRLESQAWDGGS